MLTIPDLEEFGFLRSHAQLLIQDNEFVLRIKNLNKEQFSEQMNRIANVYGATKEQVAKAIFAFPSFAGYDHARVMAQATRVGKTVGLSQTEITPPVTPPLLPPTRVTELETKILNTLSTNPRLSRTELANTLGIKIDTVKEYLQRLKNKKLLARKGGAQKGYWRVKK